MSTTIEATFDGTVFRPTSPVLLTPNTTVLLTFQDISELPDEESASFLDTACSLKLEGPPGWASNLDKYLYGGGDVEQ